MARKKSGLPTKIKLKVMMAELYSSANGPVSNEEIENRLIKKIDEQSGQDNIKDRSSSELSTLREDIDSIRNKFKERGNIESVNHETWKITEQGVAVFNFVENIGDIKENFEYLENIRQNPNLAEYDMYKELIQGGSIYVRYSTESKVTFAPSKFMGYKDNKFSIHNQYKSERDGILTNFVLNELLGERENDATKGDNPKIEREFVNFCKQNGFDYNFGKYPGKRRFWKLGKLSVTEKPIVDNVSNQDNIDENPSHGATILDNLTYRDTTNLILYGPPGTSKTYDSITKAVKLCINSETEKRTDWENREEVMNLYEKLSIMGRIKFVTFHQSLSYEEFVEGLRPTVDKNNISGGFSLEPKDGIFKELCNRAKKPPILDSKRTVFQIGVDFNWSQNGAIQKCLEDSVIQNEWWTRIDLSDFKFGSLEDFEGELKLKLGEDNIVNTGGLRQLYEFRFEMKEGDYIVLAKDRENFVALGEVSGPYYYNIINANAPHQRKVDWLWVDREGRDHEDIYSSEFKKHATYKLISSKIKWNLLNNIVFEENTEIRDRIVPNFVLIIDEINRANISKVFGELITLLESDKRIGAKNKIQVELPYSRQRFGVPRNLHIIGTMNTADRTIALLDKALRRRFKFEELMPDKNRIKENLKIGKFSLRDFIDRMNNRIEFLHDRENQIGHALFMKCNDLVDGNGRYDEDKLKIILNDIFKDSVIPLLAEYFFEDRSKVAQVLGDDQKADNSKRCFLDLKKLTADSTGLEPNSSDSDTVELWEVKDKFEFENLEI